jgi:uncharacterized protein YndB with AHSA1/START domain
VEGVGLGHGDGHRFEGSAHRAAAGRGGAMSVIECEADVAAPAERVWAVVSDPRNLPRWDRRIAGVRDLPKDGLRPGSTYVVELRFMGVRAELRARVLELVPPERSRVRLSGIIDATVESWVDAVGPARSRLRHRVDYAFGGGAIGGFAARAVRMLGAQSLLRRGVMAQKRQAESDR